MREDVANSSTYLDSEYGKSSGGCWKSKTGLEKKLIFFSTFLALAVIGLIVAVVIVSKKETDQVTPEATTMTTPPEVCQNMECMAAATYLLKTMNIKADPCEDFHEFVCGQWVVDNPIPADKGRYGVFDDLRDNLAKDCIDALETSTPENETARAVLNARAFYKSCLKTETMDQNKALTALTDSLNALGVSPDLTNILPGFDVYDVISGIRRLYGLNFILSFSVGPDVSNTVNNVISLDQPSAFGLGRSFLVNFNNDTNERIDAYKKYMKDCLHKLSPTAAIDDLVDDILAFEVSMTNLTTDPVARRDASTWYNPMTIEQLDAEVEGSISFSRFINNVLKDSLINVDNETVVIAKAVNYFQNVSDLIDKTNKITVSNYLAWRLVQSLGPSLSREFREIQFKFDKVDLGIQKAKKNDVRCFEMTNGFFGHAVGRLYIEKISFKDTAKNDVNDMVDNLYNAFRVLVKENEWMDDSTKERSIEKLDKMVKMMAFPEWTLIDEELDSYYNISELKEADFFSNFETAMKFSVESSVQKLEKANDRTADWISSASIVNAFYSPTFNSITFPAGILQNPFYSNRLKVLNYGGIGYVIGHEITHGFDDSGRQYDGDGRLNNWWTNETLDKYVTEKECFIDQYSSITDPLSGKPLNGAKTIGENIADNGGIRESYRAYIASGRQETRLPGLENFTDLQLFYISAGSIWCSQFTVEEMINQIDQGVHSPGMYRAYVPLANDKGFAEAFNCKLGSKMNPESRCTIW